MFMSIVTSSPRNSGWILLRLPETSALARQNFGGFTG
jgi:hypothetical protein